MNEIVKQLIAKYEGQYAEKGGSPEAMNQCVDLANAYISEFLGHDVILGADADMFPSRCMDFCDWIPYVSGSVPQVGDIMIWDCGNYGHIAIFVEGNSRSFISFDQNWPEGSVCHKQSHNYQNVTGFLRPKEAEMSCYMDAEKAKHMRRNVVFRTFNLILGRDGDPKEQEVADNESWIERDSGDSFNYKGVADYIVNLYNCDEARAYRQRLIDEAVLKNEEEWRKKMAEQVKKCDEAIAGYNRDLEELESLKNREIEDLRAKLDANKKTVVIESVIYDFIKSLLKKGAK